MAASVDHTFGSMIRKLEKLSTLDAADRRALRDLPVKIRTLPANSFLVREGSRILECCLLLDGYTCRHKTSSSGGRQIVSFGLAGDILDLQHLLLPRADHNVETITDAVVGYIPVAEMKRLALERPAVAAAFWRDTLIEASIFREWVLNVGRRDGKARVAHMLSANSPRDARRRGSARPNASNCR